MESIGDTTRLLQHAGVIDHRRPDDAALLAWHELLGPYTLRDCLDALNAHRRESTEYLQPAHIVARVRAMQRVRSLSVPSEANPEIERDYPAACRALAAAVRNGVMDRAAYEEYVEGSVPAETFIQQRLARAAVGQRARGAIQ